MDNVHGRDTLNHLLLGAVQSKEADLIKHLLEKGYCSSNHTIQGHTILCSAIRNGSKHVMIYLLDNGADPNARCVSDGCTALHVAVTAGSAWCTKMLVRYGADVRLHAADGLSAQQKVRLNQLHGPKHIRKRSKIVKYLDQGFEVLVRSRQIFPYIPYSRTSLLHSSNTRISPSLQSCPSPRANASADKFSPPVMHRSLPHTRAAKVSSIRDFVPSSLRKSQSLERASLRNLFSDTPYIHESNMTLLSDDANISTYGTFNWIQVDVSGVAMLRKEPIAGKDVFCQDLLAEEIYNLSKLRHNNLLLLLSVSCKLLENEKKLLEYPLLEATCNTNLYNVLHSGGGGNVSIPVQQAIYIAHQTALALMYMHYRGYVHCGVSSQSIMVQTGDDHKIELKGVVKLANLEFATRSGNGICSTRLYRAGQYRDSIHLWWPLEMLTFSTVTPATDVYSLSVTFWEMLTGCIPRDGLTPRRVIEILLDEQRPIPSLSDLANASCKVSSWMEDMLEQGLYIKPEQRDVSMSAICQLMADHLQSNPVDAKQQNGDFTGVEVSITRLSMPVKSKLKKKKALRFDVGRSSSKHIQVSLGPDIITSPTYSSTPQLASEVSDLRNTMGKAKLHHSHSLHDTPTSSVNTTEPLSQSQVSSSTAISPPSAFKDISNRGGLTRRAQQDTKSPSPATRRGSAVDTYKPASHHTPSYTTSPTSESPIISPVNSHSTSVLTGYGHITDIQLLESVRSPNGKRGNRVIPYRVENIPEMKKEAKFFGGYSGVRSLINLFEKSSEQNLLAKMSETNQVIKGENRQQFSGGGDGIVYL